MIIYNHIRDLKLDYFIFSICDKVVKWRFKHFLVMIEPHSHVISSNILSWFLMRYSFCFSDITALFSKYRSLFFFNISSLFSKYFFLLFSLQEQAL